MRIEHQEVSIAAVMEYFIKGYELPEGVTAQPEWLYDPCKGRVMFKFYIENEVEVDAIQARQPRPKLG